MNKARLLFTAFATTSFSVSAWAQTAPVGEASTELEEVVVTAEKRTENVQKTAIAISVISGDDAKQKSQNALEDMMRQVPGLVTGGQATGANVYVRGVGSNAQSSIGDPGVAINVDGVYKSANQTALSSQFDLSRVEVLRGPQGTLYGRNTLGGTINVLSNDPTNAWEAGARVQLGNYHLWRIDGMVNAPVTDSFALRIVGNKEKRDGFLTNGGNSLDDWSTRVKAQWTINEDLRLLATWDHSEVFSSVQNSVPGRDVADNFRVITNDFYNPDNAWQTTYPASINRTNNNSYKLQLDAGLGFAQLTVLPSYAKLNTFGRSALVFPSAVNPDRRDDPQIGSEVQKTVEARLASLEGSVIKWVGGIYALDTDFKDNIQVLRTVSPGSYTQQVFKRPVDSRAVFGQLTYPLTDAFRLTGGMRYNVDTKENEYRIIRMANPASTPPIAAYDSGIISYSGKFKSTTYKAGVEYDVAERSMLYLQVASGYKAGGISNSIPPLGYDPERLTAYEIGSKNRFLGNRLQLNLEGYYYHYNNYQYQVANAISTQCVGGLCSSFTNFLVFNARGTSTNSGVEAEAQYKLTENDEFSLSAAYMHTEIGTAFLPDNCVDTNNDGIAETCSPGGEITGSRMANSPEWAGGITYRHKIPLAGGASIAFGPDVKYSSSYYTTPELQLPNALQRSFTRLDFYAGFNSADGRLAVNVYGKNLTNAIVYSWQLPLGRGFINDPRTYGLSAEIKF